MKYSAKKLSCFLLMCLFYHLAAFAIEDDFKDDPALFTSEQLGALTSDSNQLIGGGSSAL